jgi:4-amino-4-deoxy-L-arabinose transferase-like glycosyltransferase
MTLFPATQNELQSILAPPTSTSPNKIRSVSIAIIVLLWAAIYVAGMFTPALLDDADSVHAEAAREMVLGHDWVTLHINDGVRYLEKAPLMYWSVAGSYLAFGIHDWSSRLPLILGILALLLGTYFLGCRACSERGGFYSAVVLGTSLGPYLFTRFLIPDTLVALWLTLSLLFFVRSLDENPPSRWTCWGLAASCALNVLTKGLIGLVFPAVVIVFYLLLTGNLRHLLRLRLISSSAVFFLIAAPWHILAAIRNPDQGSVRGFLWFYFVNEHFLRYLNKRVPRDYDTVPLLVFWGLLLVWLLPWFVFLPPSLKNIPLRWRSRLDREASTNLLFLLWALVIMAFFSFSTRQEYYMIPALPAVALLIGGWLAREAKSKKGSADERAGVVSSQVLFAFGVIAFLLGMFFVLNSKTPAPGADLADLLKKNPEDYALAFGHFFDLTPQAIGFFRGSLLSVSLALLLGTAANWILRRKGKPAQANLGLAIMMVILLACVHSAFVTFSPILSSHELAMALQEHYRPGDVVVVAGEYEDGSSLNFYTGIQLHILHAPSANLWYGSQFPDAPRVFETQATFDALWSSPRRVFLWTDEENPKQLRDAPRYVIARSGGKSLLSNHPDGGVRAYVSCVGSHVLLSGGRSRHQGYTMRDLESLSAKAIEDLYYGKDSGFP